MCIIVNNMKYFILKMTFRSVSYIPWSVIWELLIRNASMTIELKFQSCNISQPAMTISLNC